MDDHDFDNLTAVRGFRARAQGGWPSGHSAHGNKEVVGLLERWLDEARKGKLVHAAIAVSSGGDDVGISYAGDLGVIPQVITGLDTIARELQRVHADRQCGERKERDASFHEYNLATDAHNWDFLIWLVDAEMTRVRENAPAPLKIAFTHLDELNDKARTFFENVYRPLLPLIGAIEDHRAVGGRRSAALRPYQICMAARRGEKVPLLRAAADVVLATRHKLNGRKPVTITLREAKHWPGRNSNWPVWLNFAHDLKLKGEDVIFVRDTAKGNNPLPTYGGMSFETWPQASFHVADRMALYQEAKINLFVSNGPAGLGIFSDRPYLYFQRLVRDDQEYAPHNPDWWVRNEGIGEGEQWPWARPDQRMIWKPDDYRNLCEAWERYAQDVTA